MSFLINFYDKATLLKVIYCDEENGDIAQILQKVSFFTDY
jgi:hypothetical protein